MLLGIHKGAVVQVRVWESTVAIELPSYYQSWGELPMVFTLCLYLVHFNIYFSFILLFFIVPEIKHSRQPCL